MRRRALLFRSDESGVTAVEFGLLATPVCLLLIGGFEVAHEQYVHSVMQGALNDAARRASVESPVIDADGDTIEAKVENSIRELAGPVAVKATIDVTQTSYSQFSDIGNPEKILTDVNGNGAFDEEDGDCFEDANGNEEFDLDSGEEGRGGASEVVFYEARVALPRLFPLNAVMDVSPDYVMTLKTAVRNQPYRDKPVAPVICAEPAS